MTKKQETPKRRSTDKLEEHPTFIFDPEKMVGLPNYRHIIGNKHNYADDILVRLEEYKQASHPALIAVRKPSEGDFLFEHGKDFSSSLAFMDAGQLLRFYLEWAANHQAGLILNKARGSLPPRFEAKDNKRRQDYTDNANRHAHELDGAQYNLHAPATNRRIAARLLPYVFGMLGWRWGQLGHELSEALTAIDHGQMQPILTAEKGKRKPSGKGYSAALLRLSAVGHVEARIEQGLQATPAVTKVAEAYSIGISQLEHWRQGKNIGFESANHLDAKADARARVLLANSDWGKELLEANYGDARLEADGKRYNSLIDKRPKKPIANENSVKSGG